ncbi:MAG: metal ABC transporter substrate-binding protein [Halobacteriales archaeon]|nr:metal ABC transporter substrate-binding protein [Halobacteriales archaeon]
MGYTRRSVLTTLSGAGAAGLTGCLSGNSATDDGAGFDAAVSFPVIYDFTANVVPESAEAENLVPVGQHGHGWEPSPDVQRSVASADAFVYVFEGFQPWADDMVANLRNDNPDVAVVEAGADVELLEVGESVHEHGDGEGHEEDGHAHEDHNGTEGDHGDDEGHEEDHEGGHEESEGDEGEEHDHEDGNANPHFWLDPLRAKTTVDSVADGLAEAHGTDGYTENAEAYKSRLDELHEDFESSLSSASKDTVLVAGHDAFAYLGARYGFRVETLTGVSPDQQPSPQDIRRAQDLIDEEGIEYVLAPVFESDRAARSLVNDTTATEVLPITAFAGFSQDWLDDGWGYVEVMRNVNLSSLEKALEA